MRRKSEGVVYAKSDADRIENGRTVASPLSNVSAKKSTVRRTALSNAIDATRRACAKGPARRRLATRDNAIEPERPEKTALFAAS